MNCDCMDLHNSLKAPCTKRSILIFYGVPRRHPCEERRNLMSHNVILVLPLRQAAPVSVTFVRVALHFIQIQKIEFSDFYLTLRNHSFASFKYFLIRLKILQGLALYFPNLQPDRKIFKTRKAAVAQSQIKIWKIQFFGSI